MSADVSEAVEGYDLDVLQPMADWDRERMVGARQGLIHALITVRNVILQVGPDTQYREIPARFTRKRREAQALVDALRIAEDRIDRQQKGCEARLEADLLVKARRSGANGTAPQAGMEARQSRNAPQPSPEPRDTEEG